jgi:hypothetical protein
MACPAILPSLQHWRRRRQQQRAWVGRAQRCRARCQGPPSARTRRHWRWRTRSLWCYQPAGIPPHPPQATASEPTAGLALSASPAVGCRRGRARGEDTTWRRSRTTRALRRQSRGRLPRASPPTPCTSPRLLALPPQGRQGPSLQPPRAPNVADSEKPGRCRTGVRWEGLWLLQELPAGRTIQSCPTDRAALPGPTGMVAPSGPTGVAAPSGSGPTCRTARAGPAVLSGRTGQSAPSCPTCPAGPTSFHLPIRGPLQRRHRISVLLWQPQRPPPQGVGSCSRLHRWCCTPCCLGSCGRQKQWPAAECRRDFVLMYLHRLFARRKC